MSLEAWATIGKCAVAILLTTWGLVLYCFVMYLILSKFRWLRSLMRITNSLTKRPRHADHKMLIGAAIEVVATKEMEAKSK